MQNDRMQHVAHVVNPSLFPSIGTWQCFQILSFRWFRTQLQKTLPPDANNSCQLHDCWCPVVLHCVLPKLQAWLHHEAKDAQA